MRVCKRCFEEYDEEDDLYVDPTEDIEDLLEEVGVDDINDLCPDCREELGVSLCLISNGDLDYFSEDDEDEDGEDDSEDY